VSVATGYGLDDRVFGARIPVRSRIFSSPCCPNWLWGPAILLYIMGTWGSFARVKPVEARS
jgi:hypothetical protein